jgi:hypothetical protein
VIISGEFIAEQLLLFPALKQKLGGHKFKDDCKMEAVVTQLLTTEEAD